MTGIFTRWLEAAPPPPPPPPPPPQPRRRQQPPHKICVILSKIATFPIPGLEIRLMREEVATLLKICMSFGNPFSPNNNNKFCRFLHSPFCKIHNSKKSNSLFLSKSSSFFPLLMAQNLVLAHIIQAPGPRKGKIIRRRFVMLRQRICRRICGRGENTAKNRLRDPHIQGVITSAAHRKDVWQENKWSGIDPTRECSSSHTPATTVTPCPLTGTLSPAAPATSPPPTTPRNPLPRRRRRPAGTTWPNSTTSSRTMILESRRWSAPTMICSPDWRISSESVRRRTCSTLGWVAMRRAPPLPPPPPPRAVVEWVEKWRGMMLFFSFTFLSIIQFFVR